MTEPTVSKWGQFEPLADGTCHCGQPMKYNLAAGIVGHTDPAVNATCAEPWPDEPNPARWALSRGMTATLARIGEAMDRTVLARVKRGDHLSLVTDDGVKHEIVVTGDPEAHTDGMVAVSAANAEAHAAMERITALGHRFAVHVPDDAIPNGHGGWWQPGPEPDGSEPADLSGWTDAGYIDEAVPAASALGLEPHHRRGKERTDEEAAVLAPKMATGGVVESGPGDLIRVRLSGGCVPPGLGAFFDAETLAEVNRTMTPAELADRGVTE